MPRYSLEPDNIEEKMRGKIKYTPEYSMWYWDYARLDLVLRAADEWGIKSRAGNTFVLRMYSGALEQLFFNLSYFLVDDLKEEYLNKIKVVIKNVLSCSDDDNIPLSIINDLRTLHMELLELRQLIGMGLPISRKLNKEDSLKKAFKGE